MRLLLAMRRRSAAQRDHDTWQEAPRVQRELVRQIVEAKRNDGRISRWREKAGGTAPA